MLKFTLKCRKVANVQRTPAFVDMTLEVVRFWQDNLAHAMVAVYSAF